MKKGVGKVVISTLFEGHAVKAMITKTSPDKLIFLIDDPKKEKAKTTLKNSLEEIKGFYSGILEIEIIKIKSYDMFDIVKKVSSVIQKESSKGNIISGNLTEGRKTVSFALLISFYLNKEKVDKVYYITEEEHELMSLPIIKLGIGESKKKLLKEISKGNGAIHGLEKNLNIKQSAIYQHIQEMKEEGYLEDSKELKLTDLGRIMIL